MTSKRGRDRRREGVSGTVVDEIRARAAKSGRAPRSSSRVRTRPDPRRRSPTRSSSSAWTRSPRSFARAGSARASAAASSRRRARASSSGALAILAAGGCMAPIPDDATAEANAELARRARLHWIAAEADGFALRAGPAPGPVDGAGDAAFRALRPAYLRFTSGTTAERKGVLLGHDAILARLAAANRGARDRRRRPRPLAPPDGASLRGVDPPLPPLRRGDPAAGEPPRAPGARARRRGARDGALRVALPLSAARQGRVGARASTRRASRSRRPRVCARRSPRVSASASASRSRRRSASSRWACPS